MYTQVSSFFRRFLKYLAFFLFFSIFYACGTRAVNLVPMTSPLAPNVKGSVETEGDSCQYSFLGLIPISERMSLKEALDECLSKSKTEVLTDVTIEESNTWLILFTRSCIEMRGLGVKTSDKF